MCYLPRVPPAYVIRRVWRYQRDNQNPYIEVKQTTQWQKGKVQKDKQRSTKHTEKSKDRVTRTQLKTGDDRICSRRVRYLYLHGINWNYVHDRIISLRGDAWAHKTSLIRNLLLKWLYQTRKWNDRVFMCYEYRFCLFQRVFCLISELFRLFGILFSFYSYICCNSNNISLWYI